MKEMVMKNQNGGNLNQENIILWEMINLVSTIDRLGGFPAIAF
jgi:hypothetical protein